MTPACNPTKPMPAEAPGLQPASVKAELYSRDILRLAASLPHGDRIAHPDATATLRSPVCGSEIAVDILVTPEGMVDAVAFRARACALGQASAALLRECAPGRPPSDLESARATLFAALTGSIEFDRLPPELACFAPARDHPGRHAAILLPYDAVIAALNRTG